MIGKDLPPRGYYAHPITLPRLRSVEVGLYGIIQLNQNTYRIEAFNGATVLPIVVSLAAAREQIMSGTGPKITPADVLSATLAHAQAVIETSAARFVRGSQCECDLCRLRVAAAILGDLGKRLGLNEHPGWKQPDLHGDLDEGRDGEEAAGK